VIDNRASWHTCISGASPTERAAFRGDLHHPWTSGRDLGKPYLIHLTSTQAPARTGILIHLSAARLPILAQHQWHDCALERRIASARGSMLRRCLFCQRRPDPTQVVKGQGEVPRRLPRVRVLCSIHAVGNPSIICTEFPWLTHMVQSPPQ